MPQKPSFGEIALSWLGLPFYVWQGLGVRRRTHRMSPPPNPGWQEIPGSGRPMRLLVIGDLSAAGVGVETLAQSFAGQLPRFLNQRSGRPVATLVAGMNSATSGQLRDHVVPHIEPRDFDYVALNIGTNDAKNFHSRKRFCAEFGTLLYALRTRFPAATIIWAGVLDLSHVPALPFPLNRILGVRARLMDTSGKRLCRERGALAPEPEWRIIAENFSADGFHASAAGYREWAERLAAYILSLENGGK